MEDTTKGEKNEDTPKLNNQYINLNEGDADVNITSKIEEDMSYLTSTKTWKKLKIPEKLEERLIQLGFKKPSKIQATVIKLSKKNSVFAQSQNGSGKTLAFLIPSLLIVDSTIPIVNDSGVSMPQVIILADTRPLIGQIKDIAQMICESVYDNIVIEDLFSGKKSTGGHIMITTTGFLVNMFKKNRLHSSKVKLLVVDEADKVMKSDLTKTFLPQLIIKGLNKDMKLLLTTATSTDISKNFVNKMQDYKTIVSIELERDKLTLKNVKQLYIKCQNVDRFEILNKIISQIQAQNILIFANSKRLLKELLQQLEAQGHKALQVSSNTMRDTLTEAKLNNKKIKEFLQGKYRILITTDLLSRGIDMRKVTLVVNLELPKLYKDKSSYKMVPQKLEADTETYLHRVGRTGRYGDHGIALNFVTNCEQQNIFNQIVDFYKISKTISEINLDKINTLQEQLKKIDEFNMIKREQTEEQI